METGTRVIVHLVPSSPSDPRPKVRGRLAHPYDGEGAVHLRSGNDRTIVPAEQVKYVETRSDERADDYT